MIDIIIVNYNSTDFLNNCLYSIEHALDGRDANIFVQDNASTDGVTRILENHPQVHLTCNAHNLGFSRAVNQGLRKCRHDYVLLLNPDTLVSKDFFEAALSFMKANPEVGLMGPKVLEENGTLQNSARSFPTPLTAFFGRSSILSRRFPKNPFTSRNLLSLQSDGCSPMQVDWISGACMVVRRTALDAVGLMDEDFFMYWEDADWCKRMWENGWQVIYFPQVKVIHFTGISSEKLYAKAIFEFHRSVYHLFSKYNRHKDRLYALRALVILGLSLRFTAVITPKIIKKALENRRQRMAPPKDDGRIRILRLIARLNIGGPSVHVQLLTQGLNPSRFESLLVSGSISAHEGDMRYLFDGLPNQPLIIPELQREINPLADLKAFLAILGLLSRFQPHIVHSHTAKAGTIARLAVMIHNLMGLSKSKTVHTFHGTVFEGYFSKTKSRLFMVIERLLGLGTDYVIAISDTQKAELVEKYHVVQPGRVRKIELGFDLSPFFECSRHKGMLRRQLGIDANTLLIGIIGRLVPIKNHHLFCKAARAFLDLEPGVKAVFLVVGDGELREEITTLCETLDLSADVRFCGWIKDVSTVYADLDILALTSINEGTPVSIIESMAAGVPVISTDAGGVKDLLGLSARQAVQNGFTVCRRGILCRQSDVTGFARGLQFLARGDDPGRALRVAEAWDFVKARYHQQRLLGDIENLYLELAKYPRDTLPSRV